jgi:hypothetical protein
MMERDLALRMRETIASEDYGMASRLWDDYAGRLRDRLRTSALSAEEMAEARGLFEWSRAALLRARAQFSDRIHTLHVAAEYARGDCPRTGALRASL